VAIATQPERGRGDKGKEAACASPDREARADVVAGELAGGEPERAPDDAGRDRRVIDGKAAALGRGQRGGEREGDDHPCERAFPRGVIPIEVARQGARGTRREGREERPCGHP
jgi:hypothetical protein